MITIVAFVLAVTLWLLAALHAYWGSGGHWPGIDERSLARMVVGSKGIERMPSALACWAVAAVLVLAGLLPLAAAGLIGVPWPSAMTLLALAGCSAVFLGRGALSYIPAFRKFGPEEPFATYDKRLYAPLCLALGLGFIVLLMW